MARMHTPLQHAKYGVAAGAVFGSAMWALVVALSDGAEGTADAVTSPLPSATSHKLPRMAGYAATPGHPSAFRSGVR
jgi:hypothetical protein